jgi:hypothetical protein
MSSPTNPVEPYTQTTTQVITSFTVSCRSLDLFNNATFTVDSFDINNSLISRQVVPITNQQYLEWNNNDEYIIDLMATILGYTLVPPPTPPTPPEPTGP